MATLFVEQPLNNHAGLLENLDNMRPTKVFGVLETITKMAYQSLQRRDGIYDLVDMTAICMPDIEAIDVYPVYLERNRGARCGTGTVSYMDLVNGAIKINVQMYTSPPGCKHTPSIRSSFIFAWGVIYVGKPAQPSGSDKNSVQRDGQTQESDILRYIAGTIMNG
ncbi:hypothetical protein JR316_0012474 [Psilocybe cubensis]|uniref:Uncharacterized protein n=1 Tax=Psilocybe cubensis TaxID=181762 RepID=A0ACB8GII8_PSICU|nr:hypothetical protein JR316_0012474 [Psilocybe cubensis]KAH9475363.1 hypothetical protein JR316_0012474 [Psilocybe cubensis]